MKILPLRGYRYHPEKAQDLSAAVAPPYDQIDPEIQGKLYAMHPHNIVRITFGRDEPGDDGERNKYSRAKEHLERWIAEGVFLRESEPAIYPYHQIYRVGAEIVTRRGFIALGELSEYSEGVVLPHERTHPKPKEDRLKLLEATGADIGLIFMLTGDPRGDLLAATSPPPGSAPLAEARDLKGEIHRLWKITDQRAIAGAQALMADRSVIIADGHHRYETALEYRRRRSGADLKLMAFFSLEAPGLTILPNHRLVHRVEGFALDRLLAGAGRWFDAERLPAMGDAGEEASLIMAALLAQAKRARPAVAVVAGSGPACLLTLREGASGSIPWPSATSPAWRGLVVSVLHEGLLKPFLDITDDKLSQKTHVEYTADSSEAVTLARKGSYQAAFVIPPTTPEELQAVVRAGELLPQKSTHFYPKLLDGLVFTRLGEG